MTNSPTLEERFARVREELEIPDAFPDDVLNAAERASARAHLSDGDRHYRTDYTLVPFVTIDPEGSRDLDQALYAQRHDAGWFVLYAIADVGHFVDRGSPIEAEAWRRGVTLYGPDVRTPLYPPALGADAASLLPGVDRPCILFAFDVVSDGEDRLLSVQPSIVRSRAALSYEAVSHHLAAEDREPGSGQFNGCDGAETLTALREIGQIRQQREVARGGVSLPIAAQHVERWAPALSGYALRLKHPNDVEGWNAQISLMTGMASARLMAARGVGLLRVLDKPHRDRVEAYRLAANAVGVAWHDGMPYEDFVRTLDPSEPVHAALLVQAGSVMGGARYAAFDGSVPPGCSHAAIASYYAHVTAPLRRLADRYVLDLLVQLAAEQTPHGQTIPTFEALVDVMAAADRLDRRYESRIVDLTEAAAMSSRLGEVFQATVVRVRPDRVSVQIASPPVRTDVSVPETFDGGRVGEIVEERTSLRMGERVISLGQSVSLRLDRADLDAGRLHFKALET